MRNAHRSIVLACVLLIWSVPSAHVRAYDDDVATLAKPSAIRSALWLSTSATLVTASLGGYYALQVEAIRDRALALPGVSPDRLQLRHEAERSELTADAFFIATAALGVTSLVLLWSTLRAEREVHAAPKRARSQLVPAVHARGATLVWRGVL